MRELIQHIKEADIFKPASKKEVAARQDTSKLPEFRVTFYYEIGGNCFVRARSAEDAENVVRDMLDQEGIEGIEQKYNFDPTNRDWDVIGVEKTGA